jgi:RNA polymerase sigma factor (sigma-70 family)
MSSTPDGRIMASQKSSAEENLRLAMALLDDDEDALEEILRAYGPSIARALHVQYCETRRLLSPEDIEDVLSIALHRLWEARKDYDDKKATLRTLLYCIADNVARDVIKSGWQKVRRRERRPSQELMEQVPDPCPVDQGGQVKATKRKPSKEYKDLQQIVAKLPDLQRRIIVADAAAKTEVADSGLLARELRIPVGTVRVYRSRAMARIRQEMRRRGHEVP